MKFKIITLGNVLPFSGLTISYKECWQCSRAPQIILVVLDLGQHDFFIVILKYGWSWVEWLWASLRLSGHSKYIKIDGFFGALDTWKSSEYWLWILKILIRLVSFQKEQFLLFYSECREKIVLNWWQKRHNPMEWRKECPFWVGLVFAFLIGIFHFLGLRSLFPPISVLYSDQYDFLTGITE